MENHEVNRFKKESWKYFDLLFRSAKLRHLSSPLIESIGVSIAVLLLWLGGNEVFKGSGITSEDFLRFIFLLFARFLLLIAFKFPFHLLKRNAGT